jgi:hypothetical protein
MKEKDERNIEKKEQKVPRKEKKCVKADDVKMPELGNNNRAPPIIQIIKSKTQSASLLAWSVPWK